MYKSQRVFEKNIELGVWGWISEHSSGASCRASFEKAKVIGRRNTFMDGLFAIIFNRDLELMDMVMRLALYLVLNISCAMFFMFWIFVYRLPSYIWTFGATWVRFQLQN